MADYIVKDTELTAIADAIRSRTGKTDGLTLDAMPGEIEGIQTGGGNSGGSEFFGMLNDMWAYGTFSTPEYLASQGSVFYGSVPAQTNGFIFFKEKPNPPAGRPCYFGLVAVGTVWTHIERLSMPSSAETFNNSYSSGIKVYGTSNGQEVIYIYLPVQHVSSPSNGYEMTLILFKPKNSEKGEAPQYYADKIHLSELEANTWVTIPGTDQKVYFGFVAPELDA